jgi:UDP-glucuronate 4-epimerase
MDYRRSQFEVVNFGNTDTVSVSEFIRVLERALGVEAKVVRQPQQAGHVEATWASVDKARRLLRYEPRTPLAAGVTSFTDWLVAETAHV